MTNRTAVLFVILVLTIFASLGKDETRLQTSCRSAINSRACAQW
jgi:hypothetical protein